MEYVNVRSPVGYRFIGDIAGHKENELYKKNGKARKENNSILAEKYEKEVTMAGYHFGDEDYVILNGSIGIGLGLSGGLIMDRMDNIYFVRGGGIVSGLGGTVATGKFSVDTSGWDESKFRKSIEGGSISFGISGALVSVNVSVGDNTGARELGVSGVGLSAGAVINEAIFVCNINNL